MGEIEIWILFCRIPSTCNLDNASFSFVLSSITAIWLMNRLRYWHQIDALCQNSYFMTCFSLGVKAFDNLFQCAIFLLQVHFTFIFSCEYFLIYLKLYVEPKLEIGNQIFLLHYN